MDIELRERERKNKLTSAGHCSIGSLDKSEKYKIFKKE